MTALSDLYDRFGAQRGESDLAGLWRELGVGLRGRRILYDDDAPLAAIRRAIAASRDPALACAD